MASEQFKEQLRTIFERCKEESPDAANWLLEVLAAYDMSTFRTQEEQFFIAITGPQTPEDWLGMPDCPLQQWKPTDRYSDGTPTGWKIPAIKWLRAKTGLGLYDAKRTVEEFVAARPQLQSTLNR